MDLISASLGFVVGIIATAFAIEFGVKKLFSAPENTKLTSGWRLAELKEPLIVTNAPLPDHLPNGARVIVAEPVDASRWPHVPIRRTPEVRGNFAVEASGDRAILLSDGLRPGTLGAVTVDAKTVGALRHEFGRLWARAEVHVEDLSIRELAGRMGANVRTSGLVEEVVEGKTGWILRLTDGAAAIGVLVDEPLHGAVGRRIFVTGKLVKGTSGYPLLDTRGGILPKMQDGAETPPETPRLATVER